MRGPDRRGDFSADPMSGRPGRPSGGGGGARPRPFGSHNGRRYSRHGQRDREVQAETTQVEAAFEAEVSEDGDFSHIQPFDLFCAYLLGLGRDGSVRKPDLKDTARRFNVGPGVVKQALTQYGMDPESLDSFDFDISLARMDVQVSPPGISKRELARGLFQDLVDAMGDRCPFAEGGRGTASDRSDHDDSDQDEWEASAE